MHEGKEVGDEGKESIEVDEAEEYLKSNKYDDDY